MISKDQFINKCKNSGKFDDCQMYQIRKGFEEGLTFKQVKIYAKPEIQHDQMEQILWGFIDGLTMEQVKLYVKPEFKSAQMFEIRLGFEQNNLTMEEIKLYADPKFNFEQMWEIRLGFESGLTIEQIKLYTQPDKFDNYQMKEIREFIINNKDMPINTLKFLIQLEVL